MDATTADRPIRLLHLSDIRFRPDQAWDCDPLLHALAERVAHEVALGLVPDLVVVSGNLADCGKPEEYDLARAWLEETLWPALSCGSQPPLPHDRLLLVPGNHDVDRALISPGARSMQDSLLGSPSPEAQADAVASMLADDDDRALLLKRHRAYLRFYSDWLGAPQTLPWWQRRIALGDRSVHVAGLDSAWLSSADAEQGRLLLGRYQVHGTVLHADAAGADWRIALLHHPWGDLAEPDAEEARQTIHLHADLVLRGQRRGAEAASIRAADPERDCLELAAGCVYESSRYPNAFQWIELYPDPRRVRVLFRAWIKGRWQADRNQPGADGNGAVEFAIDRPPHTPAPVPPPPTAPEVPAAYRDWLRERYGDLDLLGKGLRQGQAIALRLVYVPAVTIPEAPRPEDALGAHGQAPDGERADRAPPALLLERIARQSLYCPAAPGAGKTTFCRWAVLRALAAAETAHPIPPPEGFAEPAPADLHARLPVLVPLRELWRGMDCGRDLKDWHRAQLEGALADWIDRTRPAALDGALLKAHLAAGSAFLLLDGLDEVPVCETRDGAPIYPRSLLQSGLADALPVWERAGNRTLLTSRPYGLDEPALSRLGLPRAPLEPLPEPLQRLFVERWFHTLGKLKLARDLLGSLRDQDLDLSPVTENPLLLTALCVVYHDGGRLPGDRWELYARMCDNVLHNRYLDRTRERPQAKARLEAIAHGMHTGEGLGETRHTPQAVATDAEIETLLRRFGELDGRHERGTVLPAAWREGLLTDSGLLLPRGGAQAAFYHLSIQEFLAAERIARDRADGAALARLFAERSPVPEWRLTLLFLFAGETFHHRASPNWGLDLLATLAGRLDRAAVKENPAPAVFVAEALGLCLAKGYEAPAALADSLRRTCLDAIEDEIPIPARQTLGLCLGRLGDPRIPGLRDPAAFIEVPAGEYVYGEENQKIRIETPFRIGRYPVTNGQYRAFIEDGGYGNRDWWSDEGWDWLQREGVTEPVYWQDRRWNAPNQPVVGVSFWEADACCR